MTERLWRPEPRWRRAADHLHRTGIAPMLAVAVVLVLLVISAAFAQ